MNKIITKTFAGAMSAALLFGLTAPAAFARDLSVRPNLEGSSSTTVPAGALRARAEAGLEMHVKDRANQEIERRMNALTAISARVNEMRRVGDSDKQSLSGDIQEQINMLNSLKAKIEADDSTTTLKEDVRSITSSYRVFALVVPQAAITAAADRVKAVVSLMESFSAKLQTAITNASSGGSDVSVAQAALTDYNAKIADAKGQADAAISGVADLKPDNGDQTVMQSNLAALKAAHAKIQAAQQDLVAARKDINAIRQNLPKGSIAATSTARTTTSAGAINE